MSSSFSRRIDPVALSFPACAKLACPRFGYFFTDQELAEGISAEEAHRIGLIDEVVPSPAELDAALERWFKLLAPGSPAAITRVKRALLHKGEIEEFGKCFSCSDAKEGTTAFLEKRQPSWAEWRA